MGDNDVLDLPAFGQLVRDHHVCGTIISIVFWENDMAEKLSVIPLAVLLGGKEFGNGKPFTHSNFFLSIFSSSGSRCLDTVRWLDWIEADGWFTDAYMFAVAYEAGMEPADSKERFICYGSALRRGDVSFFSSLAKLFVIQKEENGRMKLWMDGQPKMNAGFRSEKRPKAVVVNGKVTPVVYEKGTVKVSGVVIE